MTRKKHRGGGDAPRGGGRGRGSGRGRGGGSRFFTPIHGFSDPSAHRGFSLADEAKNTERHHGDYAANSLRHSKISFVAAGHLEPADLMKPINTEEIQPQTEHPNDSTEENDENEDDDDELMQSAEADGSPIEVSNDILPREMDLEQLDLNRPDPQFVIDITGDPSLKQNEIKINLPVRSPSPESPGSSGSEKIVFIPRNKRSGPPPRADSVSPVRATRKPRTKPQIPSSQDSTPKVKSPAIQPHTVETKFITTATSVITIDDPIPASITQRAPSPTILENPFPSGTFTGRSTQGNKKRRRRRKKSTVSEEALEDYMENIAATMRAEAAEAAESSAAIGGDIDTDFANRRPLGLDDDDWSSTDSDDAAEDSDAVNELKAEIWEEHELADFDDISTDSQSPRGPVKKFLGKRSRPSGVQYLVKWEGYETDDATWILAEHLDSSTDGKLKHYEATLTQTAAGVHSSDDDGDDDNEDSDMLDEAEIYETDLKLARLLQLQEEMGIADSDIELTLDPAAYKRSQKSKKASKKGPYLPPISPNIKTGFFPSATRFADAYDDFDPMEWDRPSLKPTKKGKKGKGKIAVLNLSDSELEDNIQNSWMKDREKKKARKQEREALRAEGLLGGGKHGKKDLKAKYKEGVTMDELKGEIAEFLISSHQSLALPPMDKTARKTVHTIASAFNLKSKSVGAGRTRFPTLIKTSRSSTITDEATLLSIMSHRRFLPRPDVRGSGRGYGGGRGGGGGGGGGGGVVHHREGDIVGASAPEIGVENRGRRMLEKMGYVAGMALGLEGREGIVKPVEAVVKISKAGLG